MRISWRGVPCLVLGGFREDLDFLLVKGKRDEDERGGDISGTGLLMQGKRGIACCSLFPSSESITEERVVNERLMTKQCENTYTQLALYRWWDAWRVSTAV
jgi:hypothetical protein